MDLETRVLQLEQALASLKSYSTIPLDIDQALRARLGGATSIGTFTAANLQRSINLSGNAQSIDVLEYPTQYINFKFKGINYKIPIFVD